MNKIIIVLFFATVCFSCKKVLDTTPNNNITDATAFATADRCLLSLNGVYDVAQSSYFVNGTTDKRGYPFGAANIEQGDMRGEDMFNVAAFFQVTLSLKNKTDDMAVTAGVALITILPVTPLTSFIPYNISAVKPSTPNKAIPNNSQRSRPR